MCFTVSSELLISGDALNNDHGRNVGFVRNRRRAGGGGVGGGGGRGGAGLVEFEALHQYELERAGIVENDIEPLDPVQPPEMDEMIRPTIGSRSQFKCFFNHNGKSERERELFR